MCWLFVYFVIPFNNFVVALKQHSSRSSTFVAIESPYMTSYLWLMSFMLYLAPFPRYIIANLKTTPRHIEPPIERTPFKFRFKIYHANSLDHQLLCSENRAILFAVVLSQCTRVTDIHTYNIWRLQQNFAMQLQHSAENHSREHWNENFNNY